MNPVRKKRLFIVLAILAGVGIAVALALSALQQNINLFYTPSQIAAGEAPEGTRIRAGGLVEEGSVSAPTIRSASPSVSPMAPRRSPSPIKASSRICSVKGRGIVALGRVNADGVLVADEVLPSTMRTHAAPK